jgi:hypothetical protein
MTEQRQTVKRKKTVLIVFGFIMFLWKGLDKKMDKRRKGKVRVGMDKEGVGVGIKKKR